VQNCEPQTECSPASSCFGHDVGKSTCGWASGSSVRGTPAVDVKVLSSLHTPCAFERALHAYLYSKTLKPFLLPITGPVELSGERVGPWSCSVRCQTRSGTCRDRAHTRILFVELQQWNTHGAVQTLHQKRDTRHLQRLGVIKCGQSMQPKSLTAVLDDWDPKDEGLEAAHQERPSLFL